MNNIYKRLWFALALVGFLYQSHAQNYRLQLSAFTEVIPTSYFDFAGFSQVERQADSYNFQHYYYGNYSSLGEAKKQLIVAQDLGFTMGLNNVKIIETTAAFAAPSGTPSDLVPNSQVTDFQLFTRSVNFTNTELSLVKSEVETLEAITSILQNHPSLKLRIVALGNNSLHTPNDGPADKVELFFLARAIPAYRVKIIANTTKNKDSSPDSQQVLLALVDLKEEIVLDRFQKEKWIAKKVQNQLMEDVLE